MINCEFIVAVLPLFVELENYKGTKAHRKIIEFCDNQKIKVVDLLPAFQNTRTRSNWINFMDSHPSEKAHKVIAEKLLPIINEQLKLDQGD